MTEFMNVDFLSLEVKAVLAERNVREMSKEYFSISWLVTWHNLAVLL